MYKKYVKRTDKYAAHDEANAHKEGDWVSIIECRPISKRKTWTVVTGDTSDLKEAQKKDAKEKPAAKKVAKLKSDEKSEALKKEAAKKPAAKKAAPKKKEDKKD